MNLRTTGIFLTLGALLSGQARGQDSWGAPTAPPAGYYQPCPPGVPGPPGAPPGSSMYEQLLPDRHVFYDDDSRCDLTWKEAFAESYVRLDYVHWNISGANNVLLGAPTLSGATTLAAVDPVTGFQPQTTAVVPRLGDPYDEVNGLRGVIGFPTNVGTLEAEAFYFQQANNKLSMAPNTNPITGVTTIGATTLFNNGVLSDTTMILYDQGYFAQQKTTFFGSEANWIFKPFTPNVDVEVSPIVGFRYMQLKDQLLIQGQDIQSATVTLNHMIESMARNNIFGPQIGLRAETSVWRFDFGAETKFIAGINNVHEWLHTQEIYNPTTSADPNQTTEAPRTVHNNRTRFAPILDLALTAKYHMSDRLSIFASYEFMLGTGFARTFDNIYYNAPASVNSPSAIGLQSKLDEFMAYGFAIGGEYTFR
ncbi:BBP7 family outer membrane beta-barrel protein [Planctomicrobium piriforme]|uniref:Putative beta barrel porin-7 (BBP7) n=1 Tax=Planctomicrobium piriforme TaxID=1576369 RepID=A0A1I3F0H0_9PLAN|nr:BBP7 family outer membrane beta-barrel protein [Planctomicrobium piriforme]SFI04714.1 Putative beta barrel porin-7 (BBP7) [Planctomicrobium piriforme]